jgi:hypothetical protein
VQLFTDEVRPAANAADHHVRVFPCQVHLFEGLLADDGLASAPSMAPMVIGRSRPLPRRACGGRACWVPSGEKTLRQRADRPSGPGAAPGMRRATGRPRGG